MSDVAFLTSPDAKAFQVSRSDVQALLERKSPKASPANVHTMAELMALVWNILAEFPDANKQELASDKDRLREALIEVSEPGTQRVAIKASGRLTRSRGAGLGERVSLEEGRARLDRYAVAKPLEQWAGPVAGAGEIEAQLGIPRSTLSHWQSKGSVVGLLRGERKLAYPLEQFVDARPLEGISDVLDLARDARAAWLWLKQPHGALDGETPLAVLKARGGRARVKEVAGRDFA